MVFRSGPIRICVVITEMTFFEAVGKCYRKYFDFKGRASKREFWWFYLLFFLFLWPLFLAELESGTWAGILSLIYFLLTMSALIPLLSVLVRRLHDVDKSAWNLLRIFIPILGFLLLLRALTKKGDSGSNRYGEPDNLPFVLPQKSGSGV